MLQSMGLQRTAHDLVTELHQEKINMGKKKFIQLVKLRYKNIKHLRRSALGFILTLQKD